MVTQLTRIYLEEIKWPEKKLSETEARKYFKMLLERGNIVTHSTDKEGVVGYLEWVCVNASQAERLARGDKFHIGQEDITSGEYCFINDLWISPSYRGKIGRILKNKLFEKTPHCKYYLGHKIKSNKQMTLQRRK